MLYAQFFTMSTGYVPGTIPPKFDDTNKTLIEASGDRAVIILDARVKNETNAAIAESECKKRGFVAWAIYRGDSFTRSRQVSCIRYIDNRPVCNPAFLSAHGM